MVIITLAQGLKFLYIYVLGGLALSQTGSKDGLA